MSKLRTALGKEKLQLHRLSGQHPSTGETWIPSCSIPSDCMLELEMQMLVTVMVPPGQLQPLSR